VVTRQADDDDRGVLPGGCGEAGEEGGEAGDAGGDADEVREMAGEVGEDVDDGVRHAVGFHNGVERHVARGARGEAVHGGVCGVTIRAVAVVGHDGGHVAVRGWVGGDQGQGC